LHEDEAEAKNFGLEDLTSVADTITVTHLATVITTCKMESKLQTRIHVCAAAAAVGTRPSLARRHGILYTGRAIKK